MIDWDTLLLKSRPSLKLNAGAELSAIREVERELGLGFPQDYVDFLLFSDGASDEEGFTIAWKVSELVEQNRDYHSLPEDLYMPTDNLFFFASDSSGDLFAMPIHKNGKITKRVIFRWDHESDSRVWYDGDLLGYLLSAGLFDEE